MMLCVLVVTCTRSVTYVSAAGWLCLVCRCLCLAVCVLQIQPAKGRAIGRHVTRGMGGLQQPHKKLLTSCGCCTCRVLAQALPMPGWPSHHVVRQQVHVAGMLTCACNSVLFVARCRSQPPIVFARRRSCQPRFRGAPRGVTEPEGHAARPRPHWVVAAGSWQSVVC